MYTPKVAGYQCMLRLGQNLFISHAMCLEVTDEHLDKPAQETVKNLQTYMYSLERYGKSPYIYPMYGLGGLPEVSVC